MRIFKLHLEVEVGIIIRTIFITVTILINISNEHNTTINNFQNLYSLLLLYLKIQILFHIALV